MSREIPAALASIKRYTFLGRSGLARSDNGELVKLADVLAILPPPADGAVAWQFRYNDPIEGWGEWQHAKDKDVDIYNRHENYETRALYAAPPADSAMESVLRDLLDHVSLIETGSDKIYLMSVTDVERARTLLAGRK